MELDKVKVYHYKPKMCRDTKLLIRLFFIIGLYVIISIIFCRAQEIIISDHDFANQDYNLQEVIDFVALFLNNKLTRKQIIFIVNQCEYSDLHPLTIFAWMEKESGIFINPPPEPRYSHLLNLCMGYGLHYRKRMYGKKNYKYYSFEVQILLTAIKFRIFMNSWQPGKSIYIKNLRANIIPKNKSTFAILTMNPFYGKNNTHNRERAGAELFRNIYYKLYITWVSKSYEE